MMNISDVAWATLEPNGKIAAIPKPESQPVTRKEFQQLANTIQQTLTALTANQQQMAELSELLKRESQSQHIFKEVGKKGHETPPPKHLQ